MRLAGELGMEPAIRGITLDELRSAPRVLRAVEPEAGVEMPHWRDAVARYARARRRGRRPR